MTETTQFRVVDFDCPTCANTVERTLKAQPGVERVDVHYATGRVEVKYDPDTAAPDDFETVVENHGYTPGRA